MKVLPRLVQTGLVLQKDGLLRLNIGLVLLNADLATVTELLYGLLQRGMNAVTKSCQLCF